MEVRLTEDGSPTLWSDEFGEAYHSRIGALREAREKFLEPWLTATAFNFHLSTQGSGKQPDLKILDACFGLGYNSFCFMDHFWNDTHFKNPHSLIPGQGPKKIEIVAIEKDPSLLSQMELVIPFFPRLESLIQGLIKNHFWENEVFQIRLHHLPLETLVLNPDLIPSKDFDLILHDAFSPVKCPELWCAELIQEYFRRLNDGGIVVTYASATPVSAALIEAGFSVHSTKAVGRKRGGLLAIKDSERFVEPEIAMLFEETTACVPYRMGRQTEAVLSNPIVLRQTMMKNWEGEKAEVVSRGKITIKKYLKIQKSG